MEVNSKIYTMKAFNVTITSRNKNSIYNFFLFFNKTILCDLNTRIKYSQKKLKKKRLTVLKSPHVNKRAQEQFEYRLFKKQFAIEATKNFRHLILLKKLNYNMFPDLHIKLKCIIKNMSLPESGLKIFDPNFCQSHKCYNFKRGFLRRKNLIKIKKLPLFLKILFHLRSTRQLKLLDLYGEFFKSLFE